MAFMNTMAGIGYGHVTIWMI